MSSLVLAVKNLLLHLFRVSTFEQLIRRLLKLAFWVALMLPLFLLPVYYFVRTLI